MTSVFPEDDAATLFKSAFGFAFGGDGLLFTDLAGDFACDFAVFCGDVFALGLLLVFFGFVSFSALDLVSFANSGPPQQYLFIASSPSRPGSKTGIPSYSDIFSMRKESVVASTRHWLSLEMITA
jgi:hypothetical protein